jgi:CRP-like cAMP-binding protein
MYVIVAGRVRVHQEAHHLNDLEAGDVFGELALLEPQPRTASVTAIAETRLLRLDQRPFNELIEERSEITRGIIKVLSRHLRDSVRELLVLRGAVGGADAPPPSPPVEAESTLTLVEKIMTLKRVDLFRGSPDHVLAEIAASLTELLLPAGQTIFYKGTPGDCMYLVVAGELRVHDGPHTLNHLADGDVFGEMALLDSAPRLASVTALAETRLLRLDQAPFYEIVEARPEVARGMIRVLAHHLRNRIDDISRFDASPVTE